MGLPVYQTTATNGTDTNAAQHDHLNGDHQGERPNGAGVNTGAGTTRAKTKEEAEADRRYEEAMEEEYAKREGGA